LENVCEAFSCTIFFRISVSGFYRCSASEDEIEESKEEKKVKVNKSEPSGNDLHQKLVVTKKAVFAKETNKKWKKFPWSFNRTF
jgi:hypothetical protein